MAASFVNKDIEILLEKLDLKKYYFNKLSRREMYQVQPHMINENTECSPAWQFITEITRYNYRARNIHLEDINMVDTSQMSLRERRKNKEKQVITGLHPMDIVVAVFLICDPIAKQDLAMHLWGCKLAIPFSINEVPSEEPSIFTWPLHSINGHIFQEDGFIEKSLANEKMPCLSFIRVGENTDLSKSHLINCVIGGTEKVHPMFFHRDSEGSKCIRSKVVEGLIEIGWILPSGSDDRFNRPRLVSNLRGDSAFFHRQIEIIGHMSTVTVCLCTTANLSKAKPVIGELLSQKAKVILLILDKNPDEDRVIEYLDTISSEEQIDAVMKTDKTLPGVVQSLIHTVKVMEQKTCKTVKLSDHKTFSMKFKVDTRNELYKKAFERSEEIISLIEKTDSKDRKQVLLPLQEIYLKKSKLDCELYEINRYETNIKTRNTKCKRISENITQLRKEQFNHIKKHGISAPVLTVLSQLSSKPDPYRKVFLRTLKLQLDNLSRVQLQPFYRKYKSLVSKANKANEHKRAKLYQELLYLDHEKMFMSFGFEHILREIGQLYEICESSGSQPKHLPVSYQRLPEYAVFILLEGYPLEILDGEVNEVPQKWVNSVINQLQISTKDPENVHVMSVLGIQSSGKSTFLNTMFGLQFAVSAGRCTRGAYLQVIELNASSNDQFKAKYILLIDTEGLRATDMTSTDTIKHDNEFSTLVIGLSDITVINLMGENATYLRENLPIVVHAFLRMNLVGLHPKCTIVHHNVDKRNKDKLLEQGRVLEEVLNDLTKRACKMEKVPNRSFRDMIEFTIDENTDYIPALLAGELPMAPVSTGYSCEVKNVRTMLFKSLLKSRPYLTGFKSFSKRLENLWAAIKTDCFVFEFRTTFETEMRLQLDQKYFSIWKSYLLKIEELVDKYQDMKLRKLVTKKVTDKLNGEILKLQTKYRKQLDSFLLETKFVSDRLEMWKTELKNNLEKEMQKDKSISTDLDYCQPEISHHQYEDFLNKIEEASTSDLHPDMTFDREWMKWIKGIVSPQLQDIEEYTLQALDSICRGHSYLLENKKGRQFSLKTFQPTAKTYTNSEAHHSGVSKPFSGLTIEQILRNIRLAAEREYSKAFNEIKQRQMKYTHKHPESILLRIEAKINENIEKYDKEHLINIQFKYDLLIAAASSIISDLNSLLIDKLLPIKMEFQMVHHERQKKIKASGNFVKITFDIVSYVLQEAFRYEKFRILHIHLCVITNSKQAMIGNCIDHIVRDEDDEMLVQYVQSPKTAILRNVERIISNILHNFELKQSISTFVNKRIDMISNKIATVENETETFGKLLDTIFNNNDVAERYTRHMKRIYINDVESQVHVASYRDSIEKHKTEFAESFTLSLCENLCQEQSELKAFTYRMYDMTMGCTKMCPLCKELCMFSKNHPDKHECFAHRPFCDAGGHNIQNIAFQTTKDKWNYLKDYEKDIDAWDIASSQEKEPHVVWKWILAKKVKPLSTIPGVKFSSDIPVSWRDISKEQVLYCLEDYWES